MGIASFLENLIYHPWWVLKTREQVEVAHPTNLLVNSYQFAKNITKKEGFRAFYRGFWPGTIGSFPSGFLYLIVYHKSKYELSKDTTPSLLRTCGPFAAGVLAEVSSIGLFVPVDVITQRMQLKSTLRQNSYEVASNVLKQEGIYGMYRGTSLTVVKLGLASGVWWLSYERMKPGLLALLGEGSGSGVLAGLVAGLLSTILTNPLDVVKTRIQTQVSLGSSITPYGGMMEGFRKMWKNEGWRGLNRGLIPKLVSQGPLSSLWALIYETVMSYSTQS